MASSGGGAQPESMRSFGGSAGDLQDPTSCNRKDSRNLIKLRTLTKRMCIAAQTALTNACFPGHRTHQQRIEDEKRGIKGCQDILAEKEKNCECK